MHRIGAQIRARRLVLGLSVPKVALAAGTTTRYMEMIEAGSRVPSIPTLFRVAAALDTTAAELLAAVDEPVVPLAAAR